MWKVRTKDFWMEELPSGFWRICVDGKKAILTRPDLVVDRDDLVLGVWVFSQQFLLCWENADGSWTGIFFLSPIPHIFIHDSMQSLITSEFPLACEIFHIISYMKRYSGMCQLELCECSHVKDVSQK